MDRTTPVFRRAPNDPLRATRDHLRTDKPRELLAGEEALLDRLFGPVAVPASERIRPQAAADALRALSTARR